MTLLLDTHAFLWWLDDPQLLWATASIIAIPMLELHDMQIIPPRCQ